MPLPGLDLNDPTHLGITCGAEGLWGHPNTRAEVRLTYARYHVLPELRRRWEWLIPALNLTSTSSIALIGCAYCYSLEVLAENGITRVVGTEPTSGLRTKLAQPEDADIQAAIEAVGLNITTGDGLRLYNSLRDRPGQPRSPKAADVLNEDLSSNASRTRLRNALIAKGGSSGWIVITENVLTVLTDAECTTLASRARSLTGISRLVHLVSTTNPGNIAGYNWKTAAQWKALLPLDTIVSLYTQEVL
jgi:hypothetical protein